MEFRSEQRNGNEKRNEIILTLLQSNFQGYFRPRKLQQKIVKGLHEKTLKSLEFLYVNC